MKKHLLTIGWVFLAVVLQAQIPTTLSYQGLLTDTNGNPVADASYDITFNFYTVASGGTVAIAKGPISATTFKGLFTVILGNGQGNNNNALPYTLGSQQYYLAIKNGTQAELEPRVMLTAVPYAFRAQSVVAVDAATISSGTVPDVRLSTHLQDLADGSLTGSKIGMGINGANITGIISAPTISLTGKDASKLATGSTAERPIASIEGQIRYNTSEKVMEYYNGTNWYFMVPKISFLKDAKDDGINGQSTTGSGVWDVRHIAKLAGEDPDNIVSVSSNQFTLQPGEYIIEAYVPSYATAFNQARLAYGNNYVYGQNQYAAPSGAGGWTVSNVLARVTISTITTFAIEHGTQSPYAQGGGQNNWLTGPSGSEIYTQVKITKLR